MSDQNFAPEGWHEIKDLSAMWHGIYDLLAWVPNHGYRVVTGCYRKSRAIRTRNLSASGRQILEPGWATRVTLHGGFFGQHLTHSKEVILPPTWQILGWQHPNAAPPTPINLPYDATASRFD